MFARRALTATAQRSYCVGQNLNKSELLRLRTTEHASRSMSELFGNDKVRHASSSPLAGLALTKTRLLQVAVFGIVGAFTPVCQNNSVSKKFFLFFFFFR